jgi:1-acyl-sn-glycerol-3-phosphate acyltransferase
MKMQSSSKYIWRRRFMRDFLLKHIGFRFLVKLNISGLENIPTTGPTILMMNHTISIDGVIIMGIVTNRFVVPMLKIENFSHPLVGFLSRHWGAVGIHRGEVDREALKSSLDLLKRDEILLIAPEGTRQPQLGQPKDGLAYLAVKANAVIVPVGVYGGEGWIDHLRSHWRPQNIHVTVGKAFRLRDMGHRPSREELSCMTEEMMYQLAALLPESYRGLYADSSRMTVDTLEFLN